MSVPWTEIGVGGAVAFLVTKEVLSFALKAMKLRNGNGNGKPREAKLSETVEATARHIEQSTRHLEHLHIEMHEAKTLLGSVKDDTSYLKGKLGGG